MSFPNDVTLSDGTNSHMYSLISLENAKSIRSVAASGLSTPKTLTISHQVNGTGLTAVDRHLVKLNETKTDTEGVKLAAGEVYIVYSKPRQIITDSDIQDLQDELVAFITAAGNLAKLLNGEP